MTVISDCGDGNHDFHDDGDDNDELLKGLNCFMTRKFFF